MSPPDTSIQAEWERFREWSRREALAIRHRAAAFGASAEHEFLKDQHRLAYEITKAFPDRGWGDLSFLEDDCYDARLAVDIVEINRLRAEKDYSPLTEVPPVQGRTQFVAPTPPPTGRQEQLVALEAWKREKAKKVYEDAAVYGTSPRECLLDRIHTYVEPIQRLFPALRLAGVLRSLIEDLPHLKPSAMDEERIRQRKAFLGTMMEVGQEIQARVDQQLAEEDPKAKA